MKQSSLSRAGFISACGWAVIAAACSAEHPVTETGNPIEDDRGETANNGGCDVTLSEIEPGAITSLGFSAEQVATLVAGEHTSSLQWVEVNGTSYGPETGRSEITVRVEPLGRARLIDRSPPSYSGDEGGPAIGLAEPLDGCRDSVAIDVRIELETRGGALAESVETTIEAYAPDFASGDLRLDLDELSGAFEAELTAPPNSELTRSTLNVGLGFSEYGAIGAFSLQSEFRSLDGNAAGQGGAGEIAHFPADDYCGSPNAVSVLATQAVRGLSLASALDALNAQSPTTVQFTPAGTSELELEYTTDAQRVCITFDRDELYNGEAGGALLDVPGRVRLVSADGRIDGDVSVQISAATQSGSVVVRAEASRLLQDVAGAAELPAQFGVQDNVSFSAHDGGSARFSAIASPLQSGGTLTINGLDVPECISNPQPIDPNASGAPGCRGIDQIPIWSARWGTTE